MSVVRIAHLSDPHFGTIKEGVEPALLATLAELKPDLVLISGDITQRARKKQFLAADAFKRKLHPIPSFAVPGNHDIPLFNLWGRFTHPYKGFHQYFQAKREADIRVGDVRVVGLNSTSKWRHVQGSLNLKRIQEKFLRGWDDAKIRIAVVHHPLDCAQDIDDKNRLKGREETMKLFQKAQIDIVLSGHVHDPYVAIRNNLILSVAGTCLSWRTRKDAPNSFNWLEIETTPQRLTITRMDLKKDRYHPVRDAKKEYSKTEGQWR